MGFVSYSESALLMILNTFPEISRRISRTHYKGGPREESALSSDNLECTRNKQNQAILERPN
jgi:hypothetical protein